MDGLEFIVKDPVTWAAIGLALVIAVFLWMR